MQKNVGVADRITRIVAGLGIVGAGVYFQSYWGLLGFMPLTTATLGWCPPYSILSVSTCSLKVRG